MKKLLLVIPYLLILSSCQLPVSSVTDKNSDPTQIHDPHSFAEPASVVVKHLDLNIKVDFTSKQISGTADWTINNLNGADNIVFDTRNLLISKITTDGQETTFTMGD